MKKAFFLLFCLLIFSSFCNGQDKSPKNSIDVNLGQLLFQELRLNYKRDVTPRSFFSTGLGYKPSKNQDSYEIYEGLFNWIGTRWPMQQWLTGSIGYGLYFSKSEKTYIELDILYRKNFYDKEFFTLTRGEEESFLGSYDKNRVETKILIGRKLLIANKLVIDFYTGAGISNNRAKETIYGKSFYGSGIEDIEIYEKPEITKSAMVLPTFHLGVNMGIAW